MVGWIRLTYRDEFIDHDPLAFFVDDDETERLTVEHQINTSELAGVTFPLQVDGLVLESSDGRPVARRPLPHPVELVADFDLTFNITLEPGMLRPAD